MCECDAVHTVYCLRDPRTGEIRYVGATAGDRADFLAQRLSNHVSAAHGCHRSDTPLQCWLREVEAAGLRPTIEPLCTVPGLEVTAREQEEIAHCRATGVALVNDRKRRGYPRPFCVRFGRCAGKSC